MSNFGVEAEHSYFLLPFESQILLNLSLKLCDIAIQEITVKKMSLNILVDCPVRSHFYISFTFIYTSNQKKKN